MELEQEIRSAFRDVPYPGDDAIISCRCEECQFLSAGLRGKKWQEIGVADVIGNSTGRDETLSTLSPSGFHYYLPGLMRLVIEDEAEDTLSHSIIDRLTAHDREPPEVLKRRGEVIQLLTDAQRSVIKSFSDWLRKINIQCPAILDSLMRTLEDGRIHPYPVERVDDRVNDETGEKAPNKSGEGTA